MANLFDQANERKKWDAAIAQVGQMGYPQNPAQPPAFTSPQPRRPTSFGDAAAATSNPGVAQLPASQGNMWRTKAVIGGAADDAQAAWDRGGTEWSSGQMGYGEQMRNVGSALVNAPLTAIKHLVSAPGYGFNSRGAPSTAADPAAQNPTDQRLATGTQQAAATTPAPAPLAAPLAAPAPAATTQPPSNMIAPGVYKNAPGQYSDNAQGMNMPAGFTGRPNPQNMAAAANLAAAQQPPAGRSLAEAALSQPSGVQAPVVRNSTNDWAARNNLRNLEVSASSITNNGGKFDRSGPGDSAAMAGYKAALSTDQALQQAEPNLAQAAMRENGDLQRETMRQRGADTRSLGQLALEQQKLNQAGEAQAITNRGKTMVQALQEQIATEKDAARRGGLAQRLRELQGQAAPAEWGVQVTPATKNVDGSTTQGSIVRYNKATGQTEVVPQGGQELPPGMSKQVGTSGGKPVYEDANGKRYIAG